MNIEESLPSDSDKSGDFDISGDFDKSRDFVTCSFIAEGILNGNQDLDDQVVFTSVKKYIQYKSEVDIRQRFALASVLFITRDL